MSDETTPRKVYRAHVSYSDRGAVVFCHYGHVSPCGQWVAGNDVQWRRTADWFDSEAEAEASKAGEITAMAAKLIAKANELLAKRAEVLYA
jgi:hypothetical protein